MTPSTDRLEQIAAIYATHSAQLHRVVRARGSKSDAIAEDACSHAWMQLLTHDYVDLGPPRWGALAWLTQTAIRKAWELDNNERRAHGVVPDDTDDLAQQAAASGHLLPGADELTEQHMRMDLVKQIPERPRRFLLRLVLGYTYDEIGAAEGASYSTVNKQIARAKQLLRDLDQAAAERAE